MFEHCEELEEMRAMKKQEFAAGFGDTARNFLSVVGEQYAAFESRQYPKRVRGSQLSMFASIGDSVNLPRRFITRKLKTDIGSNRETLFT